MTLKKLLHQMRTDGVWVLAEAAEAMQAYVAAKFPDTYAEEIKKYQTPQKYVLINENTVRVISLSDQTWAGVEEYVLDESILFRESRSGRIRVVRYRKDVQRLLSALDYQVDDGELELCRTPKVKLSLKQTRTSESFQAELLKYISPEEYEKYSKAENFAELPLIEIIRK